MYSVLQSSWLRQIAAARDRDERPRDMSGYRHFIFAFHDSTPECVAPGYEVQLGTGPLDALVPEMRRLLEL